MKNNIAIRPQSRLTLPIGVCRFILPAENGYMFMSEETGKNHFIEQEKFEKWFAGSNVVIHGTKPLNAYDRNGPSAPGEQPSDVEKARAWYCRKWDEDTCPRSTKKLWRFVEHYSDEARKNGVIHKPSPGAMLRALRDRGEMGHRPDNVMRTRTGQVARSSQLDPSLLKLMNRCSIWYWSERGRHKKEAHVRLAAMLEVFNRMFVTRKEKEMIKLPSLETVRVHINDAECKETYRAKFGERAAKERFQGSVPTLTASRVMETVVIDATIVDGWCAWRESTDIPLGRPTLYTAIDVRSRMVVAWFLTFEPPSLYGLMGLLKKIVTPNDRGIWGKPRTIVLDNAWENVSPSLLEACSSAGINVHYAPIGTPEYKAIVERMFGTINKLVFHKLLGGAVPLKPNAMKALGLDPEKTASVMVEDLDDMLVQGLWEVYAKERHRGINEIPLLVWNTQSKLYGREVVGDLRSLLLNFGQVETVTLTRSGVVTADGLRFSHPERVTALLDDLGKEEAMRTRRKGSAKAVVKIVVDPEDISKVTVWNHHRRLPVILDNVHAAFARECQTRWEYRMVKALVDEECKAFSTEEDRLKRRWKLRQMIEAGSPVQMKSATRRYRALLSKQKPKPEGDLVMTAEVEASIDGRKPIDEVASVMAAVTAFGDGLPVKGVRRGGKAAVEKQKKTAAKKKAERDGATMSAQDGLDDEAGTLRNVVDSIPEPLTASHAPVSVPPHETARQAVPQKANGNRFASLPWVKQTLNKAEGKS